VEQAFTRMEQAFARVEQAFRPAFMRVFELWASALEESVSQLAARRGSGARALF